MPLGQAPAAGQLLVELGAQGFQVTDHQLEPSLGAQARVSGWLPAAPSSRETLSLALQRFVHEPSSASAGAEAPDTSSRWRIEEEQDPGWQDAWRSWFKPIKVGKRLLIRPPWIEREASSAEEIVVVIEPAMAFGTGGHATTRLCLQALETQSKAHPKTMLDVGTGSGVLAIAAALLGVEQIVAVDNDPVALEAAHANACANGVEDRIRFDASWPQGPVELVVANIVSPVLLSLCQRLCDQVARGGALVLSGILTTEEAGLVQRFQAEGLQPVSRLALEEDADWVALSFLRPQA